MNTKRVLELISQGGLDSNFIDIYVDTVYALQIPKVLMQI